MWQKKTIKHAFFVLYSDKTWVFDQSERSQDAVYIINSDKTRVFDQSEHAQRPNYIINLNNLYFYTKIIMFFLWIVLIENASLWYIGGTLMAKHCFQP